jgi:hypothetical protein
MRAKFRFQIVRNNVRGATQFYERKYRRMITRQAAATMTHAKRSVKRGSPGYPQNHTGAYANNIRFAWDQSSKTAIVGPTWIKHFNVARGLEFGGTTRWLRRTRTGWYRSGLQRVRKFGTMRRALESSYVQAQFQIIAREELG